MRAEQRDVNGTLFALAILAGAGFVAQRFFLPLIWAAILCVASWPLYLRVLRAFRGRAALAAATMTLGFTALLAVPLLVGLRQAVLEAPAVAAWVADANNNGLPVPEVLVRIPMAGPWIAQWWAETLAQPHGLTHLFSDGAASHHITASGVLKLFGSQVVRRLVDCALAILCLFFMYLDGQALNAQLERLGSRLFGAVRWERYHHSIPTAISATVNGLVLVGLGEGFLIGIGYALAGLPSPALWGVATGVLAIVPFGAPLVFLCAAAWLAVFGSATGAIAVAVWGMVVLFVADHLVRPALIGSATRLPFLAVLIGILGGIETLGLVGLFVGPVLMVMLVTLWREAGTPEPSPARRTGS
ncbi:AI-2E family transporter [Massilia arenosa]|uniref:AI-2E family transporter n=1 Tax=Zemynaea arenosa TaxID=2561931 RepID=A0A4Y9SMG1_9BURK|nr:AI-2E family transporter [Massilia arenosa]TFW23585.1 AI-2E family transporter [Massilia arenosa]